MTADRVISHVVCLCEMMLCLFSSHFLSTHVKPDKCQICWNDSTEGTFLKHILELIFLHGFAVYAVFFQNQKISWTNDHIDSKVVCAVLPVRPVELKSALIVDHKEHVSVNFAFSLLHTCAPCVVSAASQVCCMKETFQCDILKQPTLKLTALKVFIITRVQLSFLSVLTGQCQVVL